MSESKKQFDAVAQQLSKKEEVTTGQLFGKECIKVKGKAFAAFFKEHMVFKLDEKKRTEALAIKGAMLWDPSGKKRPMKEWVQVPFAAEAKWLSLAKDALKFVQKNA